VTWIYSQRTGNLYLDGNVVGAGYSGSLEEGGRNVPEKQDVENVGPIPRGKWSIGPPFFSNSHGPFCLPLTPSFWTPRTSFLIHGDSIQHPGKASLGCIVLTREVRMRIWASGVRDLVVVEDVPLAVGQS
jgi:hypothetical protein